MKRKIERKMESNQNRQIWRGGGAEEAIPLLGATAATIYMRAKPPAS